MLEPPQSIAVGLATLGVVYAIHSNLTPTDADMKALPAGNADVDASERKATWLSAGVVCGISLLAKDPTIFVIGSVGTVALAWMSRHSIWTDSKSTPMAAGPGVSMASANDLAAGPQMATADYTMFADQSQFVSS
jgi:4-amino-4-deoxy-L-arabinose transferase-like glycosyltransferase